MARVKRGTINHPRHKKILKLAKGYRDRSSTSFRIAVEKVEKGLQYAYRDRRVKKRTFRSLWIVRINAGVREYGLTYSEFMDGMKRSGMVLDRKILAEMAAREPVAFRALVEKVQAVLNSAA